MEDERAEELSALSSIYPEIVVDPQNAYKISLSVPVTLSRPIKFTFLKHSQSVDGDSPQVQDETHTIRHLPPLTLTATLPQSYPSEIFPIIQIDVNPAWVDFGKLKELENECMKLWEEYGRCQILFTYFDHVQQAAERMFDLGSQIMISASLQDALVGYDADREQEIFEKGSYECGVCLEPKKGTDCWRMTHCDHVFCRPCLQDFYNSAITEGDVGSIACLDPTCGKDKRQSSTKRKHLHPIELLGIGLSREQARRYIELRRKKKLESDKTTIYCPRTWCQSAARSKKFAPLPENVEDYVDSDDEESVDPAAPPAYSKDTPEKALPAPADRLAICSNAKCGLAFCSVCYSSWHGEFARCWPRNPAELSEEEKASYDYIRKHTSPCPTCSSPTQKTMGCNHMKCFQCNTHFCYLCGSWLEPSNPYEHFNKPNRECYMRLWELEEGDEGQGGAFQGARRWEAEDEEDTDDEEEDEVQEPEAAAMPGANANHEHQDADDPELAAMDRLAAQLLQELQLAEAAAAQPRANNQGGIRHLPPPGPIDDMHQRVLDLEREARQVEDGRREVQEAVAAVQIEVVADLAPINAVAAPARGRGRGGHRAQQRARGGQAQQRDGRNVPAAGRGGRGQRRQGRGQPWRRNADDAQREDLARARRERERWDDEVHPLA